MSPWICVGPDACFVEGRGRAVRVEGQRVAVFRQGGRLWAMQDACPHMGASLAEGTLEPGAVRCHWHGWRFELATGQSDRRSGACARTWEVRVEHGEVWVRRPESSPPGPAPDDEDDWVPFDPDSHLKKR